MNDLNPKALQEYAKVAADIANQARTITLNYFRQLPDIELKTDGSPVTIADRECEQLIREQLKLAYPEHGVLGEEFGAEGTNRDMTWIIDPIDGTKSFLAGAPTYGTLLALLHEGLPVLGIIDIPGLDERWKATINTATMMNGQQVRTRSTKEISKCILSIISPNRFTSSDQENLKQLCAHTGISHYSSDGYAYGLMASGYVDLVVAAKQQPFDYLPVVNVIEQAGGCISDWNGNPLGFESDGRVLASANQRLHELALDICRR
jgi:inositol-phosphate phosphatase / L-galactose 1-phosphate phosphatase / histidinol-phosphatase